MKLEASAVMLPQSDLEGSSLTLGMSLITLLQPASPCQNVLLYMAVMGPIHLADVTWVHVQVTILDIRTDANFTHMSGMANNLKWTSFPTNKFAPPLLIG